MSRNYVVFTMKLCYAWFWGYRHELGENYPVLGYYAASSSNIFDFFFVRASSIT